MEQKLVEGIISQTPALALFGWLAWKAIQYLDRRDERDSRTHEQMAAAIQANTAAINRLEAASVQTLGYLQCLSGNGVKKKETN